MRITALVVFLAIFYLAYGFTMCKNAVKCGSNQVSCRISNQLLAISVELNNGVEQRFYPFCLTVDSLAQITINGSFAFLNSGPDISQSYVRLWVSKGDKGTQQDVVSDFRFFFDRGTTNASTDKKFALLYQAYITLTNGYLYQQPSGNSTILPVFFDTGMCSGDAATNNRYCVLDSLGICVNTVDCGVKESAWNDAAYAKSTSKDVKIMFGFQGTDSAFNYLRSANLMPTKYRQYSFSATFAGPVASLIRP